MEDSQYSEPVKALNAEGEERVYRFKLLNAFDSTRLFHEYASTMVQIHDAFVDFLVQLKRNVDESPDAAREKIGNLLGTSDNVMFVIKSLPKVFTWDIISGLAVDLLAGCEVEIDGDKFVADEKGFVDAWQGRPLELYAALLWAVKANYPKHIDPLLDRLVLLFGDTTQE